MPNPGDLSYRRGAEARYPAWSALPGAATALPASARLRDAVPGSSGALRACSSPTGPGPELHGRPHRITRRRTWPRLAGGALIAAACVASAAWYVPRVMADDRRLSPAPSRPAVSSP